jgi:hypothetical protein
MRVKHFANFFLTYFNTFKIHTFRQSQIKRRVIYVNNQFQ